MSVVGEYREAVINGALDMVGGAFMGAINAAAGSLYVVGAGVFVGGCVLAGTGVIAPLLAVILGICGASAVIAAGASIREAARDTVISCERRNPFTTITASLCTYAAMASLAYTTATPAFNAIASLGPKKGSPDIAATVEAAPGNQLTQNIVSSAPR